MSATYAGLSLGPVIGGVMNHNFGWRSIFYITAALAAAAALLAVLRLKEPDSAASERKERMDLPAVSSTAACWPVSCTVFPPSHPASCPRFFF